MMIPEIVIYYMRAADDRRPAEKIAKAAFVNVSDALIFWNALSEGRKRYLIMENGAGQPVTEIAHTGRGTYGDEGYYTHAYVLTETKTLPPRVSSRDQAERTGWEFEQITKGDRT